MAESFRFFKTSNPREPGIVVDVQMQELRSPDSIPALGTAVSDVDVAIKRRIPEAWQGYVFVECEPSAQNMAAFKFVKPKTQEERETAFEEYVDYVDHPWPNVIYAIVPTRDDRFPRSSSYVDSSNTEIIVNAPRWYMRKVWKKGLVYNSKITVRKYQSDHTPFGEAFLEHIQPVPGVVEWDFNGAQDTMEGLHGDIWIPSHGNSYVTFSGGTASNVLAPNPGTRHFEPTVFEDWAPYILSARQVQTDGVFSCEIIEIEPPPVNLLLEE